MEPHHQHQSQPQPQPQPQPQAQGLHQPPPQPSQTRPPSRPSTRPSYPHLYNLVAPVPTHVPLRTASSTPVSSPGLFSPFNPRSNMSSLPGSEGATPINPSASLPYLHPLQSHKVRETHKANVDHDHTTGRKLINHYEIIEELGRGMHGKVKLARNLESGDNVAIKIIPRFSKKRRLGKVTAMSTQDKSKKEIAILKKIRHPNVVALLEIIDDPELKKIYMILEHVELGEIVWRKKGLPHICAYERRRAEREMQGELSSQEEKKYEQDMERRQAVKETKRARMFETLNASADYWSLEFNSPEDDDAESNTRSAKTGSLEHTGRSSRSGPPSHGPSRVTSRAPSRSTSVKSASHAGTPLRNVSEPELAAGLNEDDLVTPFARPTMPDSSTSVVDAARQPSSDQDSMATRARSPSMADSIISHMSSNADCTIHDAFTDDFSYVPCFTIEQARNTFRDTVLGLEYLHYQGIVHRDIKPANLLWTRDHRVKISDFGVSYFGRPIRDGEPDETISESEARDFHNDFELAKTVGTPAFFAPELCYTESSDGTQPKITEQIDVWSLGVTLYCLIFARIPFLAEDEWQMFRKIATEEVYIPTKRLRPVDPSTKPEQASLYTRKNSEPYRDDDKLVYEDVPEDLRDLLAKMLTKNPDKRIRLRDVKRHNFVTEGTANAISWLDDTDPSRTLAGRKIQVDEREVAHAVVPLTFLERARSVVKKIGKVIHPRTESASSRKRATSSAASSAGDSPISHPRDARRKSLRPDDYFLGFVCSDHPLTQSVSASPLNTPGAQTTGSAAPSTSLVGGLSTRQTSDVGSDFNRSREQPADGNATSSPQTAVARHTHARSIPNNAWLSLTPAPHIRRQEARTVPATPLPVEDTASPRAGGAATLRRGREVESGEAHSSRARSVDRALFSRQDKRAEARVALSNAQAPGNVHFTQRPRRTTDLVKGAGGVGGSFSGLAASLASRVLADAYQHIYTRPDSAMSNEHGARSVDGRDSHCRPRTPLRLLDDGSDACSSRQRTHSSSNPELPVQKRTQAIDRRPEDQQTQQQQPLENAADSHAARVPCPPSPDDSAMELDLRGSVVSNQCEDGMSCLVSSGTASAGGLTTPLTSPSEVGSVAVPSGLPIKPGSEAISSFQSDPSLPALLSGASSVSADLEGDFLGGPGEPPEPSALDNIDTSDSLTPPALLKEPISGFPLRLLETDVQGIHLDEALTIPTTDETATKPATTNRRFSHHSYQSRSDDDCYDRDASDSDSDEGLTMAKHKRKVSARHAAAAGSSGERHSAGSTPLAPAVRRRDTSMSIASIETIRKAHAESD